MVDHVCPHCQIVLPRRAVYCPQCGTQSRTGQADHATAVAARRRPVRRQPRALGAASDPPERELWRASFSAKGLVHEWLGLGLLTVVAPAVALVLNWPPAAWHGMLLASVALWLALGLQLAYLKLNVAYLLTDQRLLHKHGILTRYTQRIEVIDIDDVSYRQRLLERLIGVGTIQVVSSDVTDPVVELSGIDRVREVAEQIDAARRAERVRRGLHIENV